MMGRRTERRRSSAVLSGLAAALALAVGCGSTEAGPFPPGSTVKSAPRGKSASTAALDASRLDGASDQDLSDDAGVGAGPEAGATDLVADENADTDGAGPGGPSVCGLTACAPGAPCPDLVIDADDLRASTVISTRTFAPTDCAVVEGCITQPGTRRLLRFDTATANVGTGDLVVGSPTAGVCFQFSECHQHYHFLGFSQYTLYRTDGTTVAAKGHKQSFCLEDVEQYGPAPAPNPTAPFTCQNQGLHVGWEDVYPNDIDCQWVDITGVPPGNYLLEVAVNTAGYLPESDYTNDTATVPVAIPAQ